MKTHDSVADDAPAKSAAMSGSATLTMVTSIDTRNSEMDVMNSVCHARRVITSAAASEAVLGALTLGPTVPPASLGAPSRLPPGAGANIGAWVRRIRC